jgi:hypothetical protein
MGKDPLELDATHGSKNDQDASKCLTLKDESMIESIEETAIDIILGQNSKYYGKPQAQQFNQVKKKVIADPQIPMQARRIIGKDIISS